MMLGYLLICVLVLVSGVRGESVEVTTRYGTLRGSRVAVGNDAQVDKFLNIPYARPPTGNLRFMPPEEPDPWNGIRDASTFGSQCPQAPIPPELLVNVSLLIPTDDEDCLYLNVFTPKTTDAGNGSLPVMLFIHGGGYYIGTANYDIYDGTQLAARGVVVVTINYRLTALGFLSTEDAVSPGNYGLLDQIRALEWVRDSISAFNGDPNDVTIFGQSAGSGAVSLLIMSDAAKGLFHKAIMESGVSLSPWALGYPDVEPEPRSLARELGRRLGCYPGTSSHMVSCLRTKDSRAIINATEEMMGQDRIMFRPVIEPSFGQTGVFRANPLTVLKNGWFSNITTIRGFNKDEWSLFFVDPEPAGFTKEDFNVTLHKFFQLWYIDQPNQPQVADRVEELLWKTYHANITSSDERRASFIKIMTDVLFVGPTIREIQLVAQHPVPPQYLYRFSYRSANSLRPQWAGVEHGDELYYIFGNPLKTGPIWPGFVSSWTDEDKRLAEEMMTLWSNFAKYGEPTTTASSGPKWLPWSQTTPRLYDIAQHPHTMALPTDLETALQVTDLLQDMQTHSGLVG